GNAATIRLGRCRHGATGSNRQVRKTVVLGQAEGLLGRAMPCRGTQVDRLVHVVHGNYFGGPAERSGAGQRFADRAVGIGTTSSLRRTWCRANAAESSGTSS